MAKPLDVTPEDVEVATKIISALRGYGVRISRDHFAAVMIAKHRQQAEERVASDYRIAAALGRD